MKSNVDSVTESAQFGYLMTTIHLIVMLQLRPRLRIFNVGLNS